MIWLLNHIDHFPTLIAALAALITSLRNRGTLKTIKVEMNSRFTEALEERGKRSYAEGLLKGRAEALEELAKVLPQPDSLPRKKRMAKSR